MTDSKPCVLIIEDNPTILKTLGNILKEDYSVLAAKNGEKGIASARKNNPDIILLDIMMPGMTGFDVIEVLKSDDATKNIPVIFLTGDGSANSKEKGFKLGAADYIKKPFIENDVKECVRSSINTKLKYIDQINL